MTQQPPQAPKKTQELTVHGETRVDPWYWLRDLEDPGHPGVSQGGERLHRIGYGSLGGLAGKTLL